mgnify:CR=1 FL=1
MRNPPKGNLIGETQPGEGLCSTDVVEGSVAVATVFAGTSFQVARFALDRSSLSVERGDGRSILRPTAVLVEVHGVEELIEPTGLDVRHDPVVNQLGGLGVKPLVRTAKNLAARTR